MWIVLWRKPPPNNLDWDFQTAQSLEEAETIIRNIKKLGVHQYRTRPLGDAIRSLSSEY